jgi:hypothetical protein
MARAAVGSTADEFFSDLHRQYLKPRGYRKVRHNLSRAMEGYVEHSGFQGSAYNDAAGAWWTSLGPSRRRGRSCRGRLLELETGS